MKHNIVLAPSHRCHVLPRRYNPAEIESGRQLFHGATRWPVIARAYRK